MDVLHMKPFKSIIWPLKTIPSKPLYFTLFQGSVNNCFHTDTKNDEYAVADIVTAMAQLKTFSVQVKIKHCFIPVKFHLT